MKNNIELPSNLQINQVVYIKFEKEGKALTGTIRSVHFYESKVKYDIDVWLEDNESTRIYNIDSLYVIKA
jgi:hypothetical protein